MLNDPTLVAVGAAKIFGDGLCGDVLCGEVRENGRIQFKAAGIGAEVKRSTWSQQTRTVADEFCMVASDVKRTALHSFGIAKGGRIANDEVVLCAAMGGVVQKLEAILRDDLVMAVRSETVVRQITRCPFAVSFADVNGGGNGRTAVSRIAGEGAGVGKQVQHPFACGLLPHEIARGTVIEKQSRVEIVAEIDLEAQPLFADEANG